MCVAGGPFGTTPQPQASQPALPQLLCGDKVALLGASGVGDQPWPAKMLLCWGSGLMQGLPA